MFITKLIIAFAGIMPMAPVADTTPLSSSSVVITNELNALDDVQECFDVTVNYQGMDVTVSACGNTTQQALSRLGAAVRRLHQSQ